MYSCAEYRAFAYISALDNPSGNKLVNTAEYSTGMGYPQAKIIQSIVSTWESRQMLCLFAQIFRKECALVGYGFLEGLSKIDIEVSTWVRA
jgi:hypothetical protein